MKIKQTNSGEKYLLLKKSQSLIKSLHKNFTCLNSKSLFQGQNIGQYNRGNVSPEAVVYMVRFEELSLKVCTHQQY